MVARLGPGAQCDSGTSASDSEDKCRDVPEVVFDNFDINAHFLCIWRIYQDTLLNRHANKLKHDETLRIIAIQTV